ncbi:MAG: hypothetical protein U0930_11155 [Pirellulales bacterium]
MVLVVEVATVQPVRMEEMRGAGGTGGTVLVSGSVLSTAPQTVFDVSGGLTQLTTSSTGVDTSDESKRSRHAVEQ